MFCTLDLVKKTKHPIIQKINMKIPIKVLQQNRQTVETFNTFKLQIHCKYTVDSTSFDLEKLSNWFEQSLSYKETSVYDLCSGLTKRLSCKCKAFYCEFSFCLHQLRKVVTKQLLWRAGTSENIYISYLGYFNCTFFCKAFLQLLLIDQNSSKQAWSNHSYEQTFP